MTHDIHWPYVYARIAEMGTYLGLPDPIKFADSCIDILEAAYLDGTLFEEQQ